MKVVKSLKLAKTVDMSSPNSLYYSPLLKLDGTLVFSESTGLPFLCWIRPKKGATNRPCFVP